MSITIVVPSTTVTGGDSPTFTGTTTLTGSLVFSPGGSIVGETLPLIVGVSAGTVVLTAAQSGSLVMSSGAGTNIVQLPTNTKSGVFYYFIQQSAGSLQIKGAPGNTININNSISTAGGTQTSAVNGAYVMLVDSSLASWRSLGSQQTWTAA